MIVAVPEILSPEWMIIGRQEDTAHGGRIDLLALAPGGALILIELKRARRPRAVVAQASDSAAWAESLEALVECATASQKLPVIFKRTS